MNFKHSRDKIKANKEAEKARLKAEKEAERQRLKEAKLLEKQKEHDERVRQLQEKALAKQKLLDEKAAEKARLFQEKEAEKVEKLKLLEEKAAEKQKALDKRLAEKQKAEEEKKQEEERRKQIAAKFFKVIEKPSSDCPGSENKTDKNDSILSKNSVLKKDMSLAPIVWRPSFTDDQCATFDNQIFKQFDVQRLYLNELKSGSHSILASCRSKRTRDKIYAKKCRDSPNTSLDIVELNNSALDDSISEATTSVQQEPEKQRMAVKLLQFAQSNRPPYYGTWRKKCPRLNGRRPFLKVCDEFDYDVDSDEEWEEEAADADECKSNDDESDDNGEAEDEDDGFIVEHGYLSEDEEETVRDDDVDDQHLDPETRRANMKIKAEAWKAEKLCKKWDKLKSICVTDPSCFLFGSSSTKPLNDHFLNLFQSMEALVIEPSLTVPRPDNLDVCEKEISASSKNSAKRKNASTNKKSPLVSKRNLIDIYCTPPVPKVAKMDENVAAVQHSTAAELTLTGKHGNGNSDGLHYPQQSHYGVPLAYHNDGSVILLDDVYT